ncbi:MAG: thiamine phosphate synthase [Fibrobacter sp.]|uniref:thiamine phosphate synthase n=1 Tax=Fibrobacter sp. TaxID=35828 RepID=UPI00388D69E9|nr:thiamine phosphate synthase [Fibrobacter sp.]
MKPSVDYSLYLCTDRGLMSCKTIEESVEQAIAGGVSVVQLREKDCSTREFYELAKRVQQITRPNRIPLIINDRIDIAMAVGAEGIHIGQSDMPATIARKIVGPDMIIGVSASNYREAKLAVEDGADYIGVGAMFATGTKTDAIITPFDDLRQIRKDFDIPIVVIGGINERTIPQFAGMGIDGYAVVSAIVAQPDIKKAAEKLRGLI